MKAEHRPPSCSSPSAYRRPLAVAEILLFPNGETFPICPRCRRTLSREYQHYCDRCGQRLGWSTYPREAVTLRRSSPQH